MGANVTYLHGDHLGSVGVTSGYTATAQLYEAYGARRGSSEVDTPYRYTGQRWEENDALDIYTYKARWYDPALGRFLQPDSIVPEPGNPQSLNRYAYGLNNPVKYNDPTGHEADSGSAASGGDPWITEWLWKNRWFNAHGYFWAGRGWSDRGKPQFHDEEITDEVIKEAGISLRWDPVKSASGPWTWEDKKRVAYAVANFGQKLNAGIRGLRSLLGGQVDMWIGRSFPIVGSFYSPPGSSEVWVPGFASMSIETGAQYITHELAHVIDWRGPYSELWAPHKPLTDYAAKWEPYPRSWERWAEAVTVWAFDGSYKTGEVAEWVKTGQVNLAADMDQMEKLLNGYY